MGRPAWPSLGEAQPDHDNHATEHVIRKNLHLLRILGIQTDRIEFPIARVPSAVAETLREQFAAQKFALINPGAAWPNKRWPSDRFGAVAAFLREVRGLRSIVLWGPGEESLAEEVVAASGGAAALAPPTSIHDISEIARLADLFVVRRYRAAPHRSGRRDAHRRDFWSNRSGPQRSLERGRRNRHALRCVRLSLRSPLS